MTLAEIDRTVRQQSGGSTESGTNDSNGRTDKTDVRSITPGRDAGQRFVVVPDGVLESTIETGVPYLGMVTGIKGYGVFVALNAGHGDISGLVHRSNFPFGYKPYEFEQGDLIVVSAAEQRDEGFDLRVVRSVYTADPHLRHIGSGSGDKIGTVTDDRIKGQPYPVLSDWDLSVLDYADYTDDLGCISDRFDTVGELHAMIDRITARPEHRARIEREIEDHKIANRDSQYVLSRVVANSFLDERSTNGSEIDQTEAPTPARRPESD